MLNWLSRVFGLGAAQTSPTTVTPSRPVEPTPPGLFGEPEAAPAPIFEPAPTPVEPAFVEPAPAELPLEPEPAIIAAEPPAPEPVQSAAFTLQSTAGGRVFARPDDGRLEHQPGNADPEGWAVYGFVTNLHPGILFVMSTAGATRIGDVGELVLAHAFRIEESGEDAFALLDLSTEAYLCAPRYHDGVNALVNDRGVVDDWERFHLVAAEGVALPATLPPLLPPAGTPITAADLHAWRV